MSIERVTISALLYGQVMQNVLNFNNADGALTPTQVCEEVRDYWIGGTTNVGIHSWVSNSVVWVGASCQTMGSGSFPTAITFSKAGQQTASNEMPTVLCIILKFRTATAGRHGRGRTYVPTVSNGFSTNGLINAAFHSYADTAIAGLNSRFNSTGSGPLTLLVGPRSATVLADYHLVTNIEASNFLGTQRRRNIGFGI